MVAATTRCCPNRFVNSAVIFTTAFALLAKEASAAMSPVADNKTETDFDSAATCGSTTRLPAWLFIASLAVAYLGDIGSFKRTIPPDASAWLLAKRLYVGNVCENS